MKCSSCGTKFKGDYCPKCGTLVLMTNRRHPVRGFFRFLWRLICTLVLIALLLLLAFVVLDCTGLGNNPGDAALYQYTSFVRGLLPVSVLSGYEWLKWNIADVWRGLFEQSGVN